MTLQLSIDDTLIREARRLSGRRQTSRAVVADALEEYIRRRKQAGILGLFGKVDMVPGYDYKLQRRKV